MGALGNLYLSTITCGASHGRHGRWRSGEVLSNQQNGSVLLGKSQENHRKPMCSVAK